MFDISPIQILIVLVIALLVFGPKRLPEMARGLARGIRDFRSAIDGSAADEAAPTPVAGTPDATRDGEAPNDTDTDGPPEDADLGDLVVPGAHRPHESG